MLSNYPKSLIKQNKIHSLGIYDFINQLPYITMLKQRVGFRANNTTEKAIRRHMTQHDPQGLDSHLKSWLYASGSLTQQLTQLAGGSFRVEPLQESFQRMQRQDSLWLGMPQQHTSWVRDVYLYGCEAEPWVRAKSIFPILSLQGKARRFRHLGQRPIGHYLFQRTTPKCERRVLHLNEGWTRQSCYTWHGCKFIVQETFLPAFERFIQTL